MITISNINTYYSFVVVTCSRSTVLVHTMSAHIVCIVNSTSYTVPNVTYRLSTKDNPSVVAQISSDSVISDLESNDNILVSIVNMNLQETVTITVNNVSCISERFYGVIVDSNGEVSGGKKEGKLTVSSMYTIKHKLSLHL